jgi:hypothetical protein
MNVTPSLTIVRSCLVAAGIALSGLTGCVRMDYLITLDRDLSGEATLNLAVDLDGLAYVMASVERQFSGEEGAPGDEDVARARADLLAQMESGSFDEDNIRTEIESDLPPGVRLLDATQTRDGLRTEMSVRLAFDHISLLNEMTVGPDAGPGAETDPFGGFEMIDEGDTFVLRNQPLNPVRQAEEDGAILDGVSGLVETMFSDLRIAFAVEAPFEIVDHDATRRDGRRLIWVYDFEALSATTTPGIFIRYRR